MSWMTDVLVMTENETAKRILSAISSGVAKSQWSWRLQGSSSVELRPPYGIPAESRGARWDLARVVLSCGRGDVVVWVDNCFAPDDLPVPVWVDSPLGQVELDYRPESVTLQWFEDYLSSTIAALIDGGMCVRLEADGYPDLVPTPRDLHWSPPGTFLQIATTPRAAFARWQFDTC